MKEVKHILLLCLLPLSFFSQSVISLGIGRTLEDRRYQPTLNIDFNYLVRSPWQVALKTGAELEPATAYGLKYNFFLMAGFSSDLDKLISVHAFAGLADNTSAHRDNALLQLNEQASYIFNLGGFVRLGEKRKFSLGVEAYVWRQWLNYYNRETAQNNAVSLNVTLAYRFDFPKRQLMLKEKPKWEPNLKPYDNSLPR